MIAIILDIIPMIIESGKIIKNKSITIILGSPPSKINEPNRLKTATKIANRDRL